MPRFFFNHTSKAGETEVDIDGLKLPSLNDALNEAVFAAQGAVALANEPSQGVFEIEDEGRMLVGRVPYSATPGIPGEAGEIAALPTLRPGN